MTANDQLIEQARNVPIEDVIHKHGIKLRRAGQERVGPCPKCGGTDRFAINISKGIFNCRGCGAKGDVIELVEFLDGVDFKIAVETLTGEAFKKNGGHREPRKVIPMLGPIVETYSYEDENGDELFQVTRHNPKDFRQRHADGNSGWIHNLDGVRIVPYRLPELLEALASNRTIFIVEGEKDVNNIIKLGAPASCNPRGAGKWGSCNIDEIFRGANLIIIADNDPQTKNKKTGQLLTHEDGRPRFAGWDHAIDVAQHLNEIAESIRIVDLKKVWPQCPDKGDISDWIEAGGTIEALYDIADDTLLWEGEIVREIELVLEPLRYVDLAARLVPREWLIDERIPMFNVTLLSGEGAIGKSIALLQLSAAVVLGRDWLGTLPKFGPVLYIAAEEDDDEIRRRLEDIACHFQSTRAELIKNGLRVLCYAGMSALLAEPDRNDLIKPTKLFERIKADAIALQPKLIIIDPVADVFGGKENDRGQTRMFCTLMRGLAIEARSAVILSSHPSVAGVMSDSGLSGSTAWHNSVRARMYFKAIKDAEDKTLRVLEIKKNNYGPVTAKITVRWCLGAYVLPSKQTTVEETSAARAADNMFMKLLRDFREQGRAVGDKKSSAYAPAKFAKTPDAIEAHITSAAFADSMERLFKANRIRVIEEGPKSKSRSRIVEASNHYSNRVPTDQKDVPTASDHNGDDLGNWEDDPRNDPFQPENFQPKFFNDSGGASTPPDPPLPDGRSDGPVGSPNSSARGVPLSGDQLESKGGWKGRPTTQADIDEINVALQREGIKPILSSAAAAPYRIIGDTPAETVCLHCQQAGNVKKIVDSNRIGGKSETLHEHCAEAWFKKVRNQK